MYLAMNRFKVLKDKKEAFEAMWMERDSDLHNNPGFIEFRLLKGPEHEDHQLYSSHTFWEKEEDFVIWTKSESFRNAHRNAGKKSERTVMGHPQFEGFSTIQMIDKAGNKAA
ncbi:MAG: antibiotic biosynthesis monooxygenase [Rhizobiales bacterium]|nr:antibiotic biosynthesis monooxygenase [Hyphomicrobiales bacterium]